MKALEILKKIYANKPDTRFQRNNIDINFTIHDFYKINKAIKELEALENRSCDNCKTKNCSVRRILVEKGEIGTDYFSCNDWEPK